MYVYLNCNTCLFLKVYNMHVKGCECTLFLCIRAIDYHICTYEHVITFFKTNIKPFAGEEKTKIFVYVGV